jgi:hypothetical protein
MGSRSAGLRRRVGLGALVALLAFVPIAPHTQQATGTLTLAWDPNHDATLSYRVHVGVSSRTYDRTYDVGPATTFTYTEGVPGTVYYFAVSAYDADGRESGYSNEISATVGGAAMPVQEAGDAGVAPAERDPWRLDEMDRATARARDFGVISGIAALPDGRVLVVENARHVRMLEPHGVLAASALSTDDPHAAFTELVVDTSFERTGFVFVGATERRHGGQRDFRVIRYRLVGDTLGEGATLVAGLSFSGDHAPRVAVDDTGRIYVAMPGDAAARTDPYAARILRFAADGSVPEDHPGHSPVLAHGFVVPLDLDWDGRAIWVLGRDEQSRPATGRLLPDVVDAEWPRRLDDTGLETRHGLEVVAFDVAPPSVMAASPSQAVVVASPQRLYRLASQDHESAAHVEAVAWSGSADAVPVDVAVGPHCALHVVVRTPTGRFAIVRMAGGLP